MKKILLTLSAIGIIFLVSCKNETSDANDIKSVLYFNGDIITMEGNTATSTEAVVAKEGKIVFVGSKKEAENKFKNATLKNLEGNTLLPGFIEPHLHPSLAAIMLQNEIIAPYDWKLPSGVKKGVQGEVATSRKSQRRFKRMQSQIKYILFGGITNSGMESSRAQLLMTLQKINP